MELKFFYWVTKELIYLWQRQTFFVLPLLPGHLAGPSSLLKTSTKRTVLCGLKQLVTESEGLFPPNVKVNDVLTSSSHMSSCLIKCRANFTYLLISGLIFVNTYLLSAITELNDCLFSFHHECQCKTFKCPVTISFQF